ncbi:hypothetical protein SEA_SADLAD_50 [Microbacterium phage SadLad]|nr:hypothetical protein SEA_RUBYRALPH_48 [Microbacterium phage RubyRalph]QUE25597.1 hypothetical protein SEA_SADLAD_50 [Microbacterium phage SadLad]
MGARAHGRRREGREVRRVRREVRDTGFAITAFGDAAAAAAKSVGAMVKGFEDFLQGIEEYKWASRERHGGATALSEVGSPYPTQSGVDDRSEAHKAADAVEAAAARMGIRLLPWQHDYAVLAVMGQAPVMGMPKRAGKSTVHRVIDEARSPRGPESNLAYVDEAANL